jgi:hypothetical protein
MELTEAQLYELCSYLGEGIHTAFRKAAESDESTQIWYLISDLRPEEWRDVVYYVATNLVHDWDAIVSAP